jgi:uncharacterized protein DUF4430
VRARPLGAGLAAAAALAGCGLGAGSSPSGVTLTVQRDFGARRIGTANDRHVHGSDTVMRFLQRSFKVRTRYGGRFVQAIGRVAGGRAHGRPVDWFYYVNGIEAPKGAAERGLRSGDRIIWDFHDYGATRDVPAIVGSFPEPFRSGAAGKRYPLRLECAPDAQRACDATDRAFGAVKITAGRGTIGTGSEINNYRVLVGTFADLAQQPAVQRLERGVRASGVYAVPAGRGRRLRVLDARGRVVRTLGPGTGLVAALRPPGSQPVWLVTGVDRAGVVAAAAALRERTLAGSFAVAVNAGHVTGLPEAGA